MSPTNNREETIPDGATTTCQGQKLLSNIINEIPYETQSKFTYKYKEKTLKEFEIT